VPILDSGKKKQYQTLVQLLCERMNILTRQTIGRFPQASKPTKRDGGEYTGATLVARREKREGHYTMGQP